MSLLSTRSLFFVVPAYLPASRESDATPRLPVRLTRRVTTNVFHKVTPPPPPLLFFVLLHFCRSQRRIRYMASLLVRLAIVCGTMRFIAGQVRGPGVGRRDGW